MEPIQVQGRTLSGEDVAAVQALIAAHPQWGRTALSRQLCEVWNWRNGAGRLKDMAARSLLVKLEARGLITLPARRKRHQSRGRLYALPSTVQVPLALPPPPAIEGPLASVQPVSLELVDSLSRRRQVQRLLAAYHYRGFRGAVGDYAQMPVMRSWTSN